VSRCTSPLEGGHGTTDWRRRVPIDALLFAFFRCFAAAIDTPSRLVSADRPLILQISGMNNPLARTRDATGSGSIHSQKSGAHEKRTKSEMVKLCARLRMREDRMALAFAEFPRAAENHIPAGTWRLIGGAGKRAGAGDSATRRR
jgi:hypothetical protein